MVYRVARRHERSRLAELDRIVCNGEVILMLHQWSMEHGTFEHRRIAEPGPGFLLWIYVDDIDAIYARALAMRAKIVKAPWRNSQAGWREFTIKYPDGYSIALAQF